MAKITVDIIIMIFMDMECFKEVKFKYRVGSANNFSRIKAKVVVIFPAMFSNGRFVGFLILNTEFIFIQMETQSTFSLSYVQQIAVAKNIRFSQQFSMSIVSFNLKREFINQGKKITLKLSCLRWNQQWKNWIFLGGKDILILIFKL